MAVYNDVKPQDIEIFLQNGYRSEKTKISYEVARLKGKATVILFSSGKLVIQGTQDGVQHAKKIWEKRKITPKEDNVHKQVTSITGSDECMKGDTFGGLIVASVYAEPEEREMLRNFGVHDSKRINDNEIPLLATKIKRYCKYKLIKLTPKQYNERRKKEKLTEMLNALHNEAYISGTHVVDKFPGCIAGHESVVKAESKFVEVAAASILARDAALSQFKQLEKKFGAPIPKGSTHVSFALKQLKQKGLDPQNFVKLDFKNVKLIFG